MIFIVIQKGSQFGLVVLFLLQIGCSLSRSLIGCCHVSKSEIHNLIMGHLCILFRLMEIVSIEILLVLRKIIHCAHFPLIFSFLSH
jgi:hypothetical protein